MVLRRYVRQGGLRLWLDCMMGMYPKIAERRNLSGLFVGYVHEYKGVRMAVTDEMEI